MFAPLGGRDLRGRRPALRGKLQAPRSTPTVSFHIFKSQNFKLSVSIPKSKYVAYLSVLSQISHCQGLGRKNKHDILKTDRIFPDAMRAHTSTATRTQRIQDIVPDSQLEATGFLMRKKAVCVSIYIYIYMYIHRIMLISIIIISMFIIMFIIILIIYIYIYIYIYTHTFIYIYIHIYMLVVIHIYTY